MSNVVCLLYLFAEQNRKEFVRYTRGHYRGNHIRKGCGAAVLTRFQTGPLSSSLSAGATCFRRLLTEVVPTTATTRSEKRIPGMIVIGDDRYSQNIAESDKNKIISYIGKMFFYQALNKANIDLLYVNLRQSIFFAFLCNSILVMKPLCSNTFTDRTHVLPCCSVTKPEFKKHPYRVERKPEHEAQFRSTQSHQIPASLTSNLHFQLLPSSTTQTSPITHICSQLMVLHLLSFNFEFRSRSRAGQSVAVRVFV